MDAVFEMERTGVSELSAKRTIPTQPIARASHDLGANRSPLMAGPCPAGVVKLQRNPFIANNTLLILDLPDIRPQPRAAALGGPKQLEHHIHRACVDQACEVQRVTVLRSNALVRVSTTDKPVTGRLCVLCNTQSGPKSGLCRGGIRQ